MSSYSCSHAAWIPVAISLMDVALSASAGAKPVCTSCRQAVDNNTSCAQQQEQEPDADLERRSSLRGRLTTRPPCVLHAALAYRPRQRLPPRTCQRCSAESLNNYVTCLGGGPTSTSVMVVESPTLPLFQQALYALSAVDCQCITAYHVFSCTWVC